MKHCPKCDSKMKIRERRSEGTGKKYLVCENYPTCKTYEPYEELNNNLRHGPNDNEGMATDKINKIELNINSDEKTKNIRKNIKNNIFNLRNLSIFLISIVIISILVIFTIRDKDIFFVKSSPYFLDESLTFESALNNSVYFKNSTWSKEVISGRNFVKVSTSVNLTIEFGIFEDLSRKELLSKIAKGYVSRMKYEEIGNDHVLSKTFKASQCFEQNKVIIFQQLENFKKIIYSMYVTINADKSLGEIIHTYSYTDYNGDRVKVLLDDDSVMDKYYIKNKTFYLNFYILSDLLSSILRTNDLPSCDNIDCAEGINNLIIVNAMDPQELL